MSFSRKIFRIGVPLSGFVVLFLPLFVAYAGTISKAGDIPGVLNPLIQSAFGVLIGVAVFIIAWGIFKFILRADDEDERATGRSMIMWGVVGLFLMISIWGMVNIIKGTLGLTTTTPAVPQIPIPTS